MGHYKRRTQRQVSPGHCETVHRIMSRAEENSMELSDALLDDLTGRLEARLEARRRERDGRSEAELGEQ